MNFPFSSAKVWSKKAEKCSPGHVSYPQNKKNQMLHILVSVCNGALDLSHSLSKSSHKSVKPVGPWILAAMEMNMTKLPQEPTPLKPGSIEF